MMVSSSSVWRASRSWCAGSLALMACLGAGSGSLRSQERLAANLAASHEVGGLPARIQIFEPNWGRLPDGAKHARDLTKARDATNAKVRDLIEELIPERFESARLSIELAEAKAEAAEIKEVSRQQEALLAALMAVLATRARHDAIVRSENADMRQRLEAVQAELQRKVSENSRLAAELAAAHKAADSATMMALENLAVIEAQIEVLHLATENAALERPEHLAELLSAVWVDVVPAMPRQTSRLETMR